MMPVPKPRPVACTSPDAHGITWRHVGSPSARCDACAMRDDLASRSTPASERQLALTYGSLTRTCLEVLLAEGAIRAKPTEWGFLAVEQTPDKPAGRQRFEVPPPPDLRHTSRTPRPSAAPPPPTVVRVPIHEQEPPPSWERLDAVPVASPAPVTPMAPPERETGTAHVWTDAEREAWRQRMTALRDGGVDEER